MKKSKLIYFCLAAIFMFSGCGTSSSQAAAPPIASAEARGDSPAVAASEAPSSVSASGEASVLGDTAAINQSKVIEGPDPEPELLTAGEWNDNKNWDFFINLLGQNQEWMNYQNSWSLFPVHRMVVYVTSSGVPAPNETVILMDTQQTPVFQAVTDANGYAYLFYNLFGDKNKVGTILVSSQSVQIDRENLEPLIEIDITNTVEKSDMLDLMFVVDTTGSMGDELEYLKKELQDVITRVTNENPNLTVRLSNNFYRDHGDDYVVRDFPFTENIKKGILQIQQQSAASGGDFEEAVETALANALYDHDWEEGAKVKILFLVLDAPPHLTKENRDKMHEIMADASAKGIRIIPVASSGIDKNTEFLLRSLSVTTNGTYVFLTDDSSIGDSHLEPTIGNYNVEFLNELMFKIINQTLNGEQ